MTTATQTIIPKVTDLVHVLTDLLGKTVTATPTAKPTTLHKGMVASYVDDEGTLIALLVVDLRLACSAGAALSMVPRAIAEEQIASGKMDTTLAENLYEVLNVASGWMNIPGRPHARIRDTSPEGFPSDVLAAFAAPLATLHLEITVEDYPDGSLSFIFV